jgi:hypothetical protein
MAYSGALTAIEALTEHIGTDYLSSGLLKNVGKTAVGRVAVAGAMEALEEAIGELISAPVVLAIDGKLDNYNFMDSLKDAGYAALIGGIIGGILEVGNIATFNPNDIGILDHGAKISKSKALYLQERLSKLTNNGVFEKLNNPKIQIVGDSLGLSTNDLAEIRKITNPTMSELKQNLNKTDYSKSAKAIVSEYKQKQGVNPDGSYTYIKTDDNGNQQEIKLTKSDMAKIEQAFNEDFKNIEKTQKTLEKLSELYTMIGPEKFTKAKDLFDASNKNRQETAMK